MSEQQHREKSGFETRAIHAGYEPDPTTGAVITQFGANASAKDVSIVLGMSTAQVTINGNLVLDAGDVLAYEINGLTAGTQHDQLVVNGLVDLGGATLDTTGSTIVAALGESVQILSNDAGDAVTDLEDGPDLGEVGLDLELLDPVLQDRGDLFGA